MASATLRIAAYCLTLTQETTATNSSCRYLEAHTENSDFIIVEFRPPRYTILGPHAYKARACLHRAFTTRFDFERHKGQGNAEQVLFSR